MGKLKELNYIGAQFYVATLTIVFNSTNCIIAFVFRNSWSVASLLDLTDFLKYLVYKKRDLKFREDNS